VVAGDRGTAHRLAALPVRMGGKTGTAQVIRKQEGVKWQDLPWEQRHHALFAGYAPAHDPRLVVVVVVEHGGDAASVAAPVAGRILARAFGPPVPVDGIGTALTAHVSAPAPAAAAERASIGTTDTPPSAPPAPGR
jgi:penicillin-binding protein 2